MAIRKPVKDSTIKLSKENKIKLEVKEIKLGRDIRKMAFMKIEK